MFASSLRQSGLLRSKTSLLSMRNKSSILDKDALMKYLTTPPYTLPNRSKIVAPPMVYISGEEMTRYTMELM